ncbi:MAG: hypothetical protein ACE5NP_12360 [Anaerolineae bacterium]
MRLDKGERFYKFFFFRPKAGRALQLEHRIFTKEKKDGQLELLSYNYKVVDGVPQKTGIIRAPAVPKETLDEIVQSVVRQTQTKPEEFQEVDLSQFATVKEQIAYLQKLDLADVHPLH